MRTQQISNIFMAISGLETSFTKVAGYQAMDDHQGNDLLKMIHACAQACNDALQERPGRVAYEAPTPGFLPPRETEAMDDTMGFEFRPAPSVRTTP